jgi:hypothetical protein
MNSMGVQGVITQSLRFIAITGTMSEFYGVMVESKTSLLIDVILPLLHTTK